MNHEDLEYPLANDDHKYNEWRRDIIAEYILQTGRTFPRRQAIGALLVRWSDSANPPTPTEVVNTLIRDGYLKP